MFFLNDEDLTCDEFHSEIRLEFPDLFEVRSTLWGFCLLQEEDNQMLMTSAMYLISFETKLSEVRFCAFCSAI